MAKEIERKFLVDPDFLKELKNGSVIKQGYLPTEGKTVVRARVRGEKAFLTLKGEVVGMSCSEFEYPIPVEDAEQIIEELCTGPVIEKVRYEITYRAHLWEVDVFEGENAGLVVAEVELSDEHESVDLPPWVTEEVTGQVKYFNAQLLNVPYSSWERA